MKYFIRTPRLLKWLYPSCIWEIKTKEKIIYLTFDDGPTSIATNFVLDELKKYNALATFFCIGKNVVEQSTIYQRILEEGHAVGNHTFNHLNGWETNSEEYLEDVHLARQHIDSKLFRPPYGRIKRFQIKQIRDVFKMQIVMWDVLSGDFDEKMSGAKCAENVILSAKPGSIIVFHDSEKAFDRLSIALPKVLQFFSNQGYCFKKLELNNEDLERNQSISDPI